MYTLDEAIEICTYDPDPKVRRMTAELIYVMGQKQVVQERIAEIKAERDALNRKVQA
jgi:uncharacterized coiled-coil DUF342 family protein